MKTNFLIIILLLTFQINVIAQSTIGNVSQYDVRVEGDNIVITTPQGDVTFKKVYVTNNTYKWILSDKERIKWTTEIVDAIMNAFSNYFGEVSIMKKDVADIKEILVKEEKKEITLKEDTIQLLRYKVYSLSSKIDTINSLNKLLTKGENILKKDKANWWHSLIPGIRQHNLGYKHKYVYWGGCGVSLGSLVLAQKYNNDYNSSKKKFNETNNPDDQNRYYDDMNKAKKNRRNAYGAAAWVGGLTYGINLIDALLISNKRKVFPKSLTVSAAQEYYYGGIAFTYNF